MPIGARDVMLVIRARDLASQTFAKVATEMRAMGTGADATASRLKGAGIGLTALGVGMAAVGAAGVAVFGSMVKSAIEYEDQVRHTFTQVDKGKATMEDVWNAGLRVAKQIPVAFEDIQKSLYDIFSSVDVNAQQAEAMLTQFAKAAVAGSTDIQTAGRATIAFYNAYLPEVERGIYNVERILDIQFETVRKGVIEYDEFARVIGRAIPSAKGAGQSIETLGGVIAFLTRQGLSAAAATVSAARGFDAMANPKVAPKIEEMGVAVKNASGEFRQINEIATDLGKKLGEMSTPDRFKALKNIFEGAGGTIQAMRFWRLAVINFDQLNQLIKQISESSGAMDRAYKIMFNQPQAQMQLFQNNLQAIRVEMGQNLIPVVNVLLSYGLDLLKWFDNLAESTKRTIATVGMWSSVGLVIVGAVTAIIGAFSLLVGSVAATFTGGSILAAIGVIAAFSAALMGIPVLIAGIVRNWDEFKSSLDGVKQALMVLWEFISSQFGNIRNIFENVFTIGAGLARMFFDALGLIAPLLAVIAGTSFVAFITALETITGALASVVDWVSKTDAAAVILATVGVALLLKQFGLLFKLIGNSTVFNAVGVALLNMMGHIQAAGGVLSALGQAATGAGKALLGLITNPYFLAAATIVAIAMAWKRHNDEVKRTFEESRELTLSMANNARSADELRAAIGGGEGRVASLTKKMNELDKEQSKWNISLGTTIGEIDREKQAMDKVKASLEGAEAGLVKVRENYRSYVGIINAVTTATPATEAAVVALAEKMGLNLFDGTKNAGTEMRKLTEALTVINPVFGVTEAEARRTAENMKKDFEEMSKEAEKWQKDVAKAFNESFSVMTTFSNNMDKSAGDIAKALQQSTKDAEKWLSNINEALKRGLDPQFVADLMRQGPEKAGPMLQKILDDTSGNLIKQVNATQMKLADLQEIVLEQTRLMNRALNSEDDFRTKHIGAAMELQTALMTNASEEQIRRIMEKYNFGTETWRRILDEFGITATGILNGIHGTGTYTTDAGPAYDHVNSWLGWANGVVAVATLDVDTATAKNKVNELLRAMSDSGVTYQGSGVYASRDGRQMAQYGGVFTRTQGMRGVVVGERGPEFLKFPGGTVMTNDWLRNQMGSPSGVGGNSYGGDSYSFSFVINEAGDAEFTRRVVHDEVMEIIRERRARGPRV